jgi:hypothetical protein
MKSIKRKFDDVSVKKPNHSSLMIFIGVLRSGKFTEQVIKRWISKLVEKDDYDRKSKKELLKHLVNTYAKPSKTTEKRG